MSEQPYIINHDAAMVLMHDPGNRRGRFHACFEQEHNPALSLCGFAGSGLKGGQGGRELCKHCDNELESMRAISGPANKLWQELKSP